MNLISIDHASRLLGVEPAVMNHGLTWANAYLPDEPPHRQFGLELVWHDGVAFFDFADVDRALQEQAACEMCGRHEPCRCCDLCGGDDCHDEFEVCQI